MPDVIVNETDLYFLAPLTVKNYPQFEANLLSAGWVRALDVPFDLYAKDSLYDSEAAFLGILKDGNSPLMRDGICFVAPEKPREETVLWHFHDVFWQNKNAGKELTFKLKKEKKAAGAGPVLLQGLTMGNILRIHVTPSRELALFLIHFRLPRPENQSASQVVSTNYWLHKTDKQAPEILIGGVSMPGFETITGIIETLMNSPANVALPSHPGRLLTATYVKSRIPEFMTDSQAEDFEKTVMDLCVHLGQSKDLTYEISEEDKRETHHLFDNILVHASPEGFCGFFLVAEGQGNTLFMEKSSTIFLKSYLPIFIESVMVDFLSVQILYRKDKESKSLLEQSEQFRELRLMEVMPVSNYSHLLHLKSIIRQALCIHVKVETVSDYIDTQRERDRQRQESNLNFLIGFMGVGQVVFAILELSRARAGTDRAGWLIVANAISIVFAVLSLIILYAVLRNLLNKR